MKKFFAFVLLLQAALARVLIQGAMPSEIDVLVAALEQPREEKIGSYVFYLGRLDGAEVAISRTLVGMSNAAAATAIGALRYSPELIINQGTAGAHNLALETGDIVLGEKIYNAGAYYSEFSDGAIDVRAHKPMKAPLTLLDAQNKEQKREYFASEPALLERAAKHLQAAGVRAIKGTIATADAYNKQTQMIALLRERYGSDAEEMEAAAAAQVAQAFGVPFLAVRVISNIEPKQQSFDERTATKCQELVRSLLPALIGAEK